MQKRRRLFVLMAPPILWLLVFFLLPLGIMAIFTFRAGSFGAERQVFTLDHYRQFLASTTYHRLLWKSTILAFFVAVISVLLAYPLAYYLVFRAGDLRGTLLTLIILPAWTSYLLRILSWRLILGSSGLFNTFLIWAGIVKDPLPILLYSQSAVAVTLIYVWTPFVALPMFAALQRIDLRLLEAAADLGCNPFQAFLRVTLPLSLPGVAAGFFFVFIPSLGEYVTPMLVGGAQGIMYGNLIQDQFVRGLNYPLGSLMSIVMLLCVLLLIFVFSRIVRLSELTGI